MSIIFGILISCSYSYSQYINDTLNVKVELKDQKAPDSTKLHQLYPNPFSPTYQFTIEISEKAMYKFTIFDSTGITLADLFDTELEKGMYSISWNTVNFNRGFYYYQLHSDNFSNTKKFLIIK